jgi:hypothetical protein
MTARWGIQPELGDHRVLRPGKWLPARAIGWALVVVFAIALAFGTGLEALADALPRQPVSQFVAQAAGALIILAAYAGLVRLGEARSPSELGLDAAPTGTLAGLMIGFVMFSTVMAIMIAFGLYKFDYRGSASVWRGAGLAIESGVFEDVIVRGVVFRPVDGFCRFRDPVRRRSHRQSRSHVVHHGMHHNRGGHHAGFFLCIDRSPLGFHRRSYRMEFYARLSIRRGRLWQQVQ